MISNGQIRKIYVTARDLGIDNELLHTYVFNMTGQEHISGLTKREAMKVIDGLVLRNLEKEEGHVPGRATKRQQGFIKDLERKLGWKEEPWRLKGFMRKYAKVEDISWLSPRQASNVIEGLKKILEKEQVKSKKYAQGK